MILVYYYKTELEEYVEFIYNQIHISNPHELDTNEIARRLNIEIVHSEFSTQATRSQGHMAINFNISLHSIEDLWETFSHELFHALKDVGNQALFPIPLRQLRESKARNFALHFCIPTFMLDQLQWPEGNAAPFVACQFHVTLPFAEQRLEQYRNRILQNQIDEFEAMVREPGPADYDLSSCTDETQRIMNQLKIQLAKKGEKLEIKSLL